MNLLAYFIRIAKEEGTELKALVIEYRWLVLFLLALLIGLFVYLRPFPPGKAVMAAGTKGGAYWNAAQAAAHYLDANGVTLALVETSGSIESARLLSDPTATIDVALIQGGALQDVDTRKMKSLGSIGYEPMWIFYHKSLAVHPRTLADLAHYRIGIGPALGGTQKLFRDVLELNGLSLAHFSHAEFQSYRDNMIDFQGHKLDVIVMVASYNDSDVQSLLNDPSVALMPMENATAYPKNLPYVYALTIPASAVDMARKIPSEDVQLIGTTTSLVVDNDLHPDIQMLLLIAARDLQRSSQSLFFARRGEFPAYVDPTIEISPTAVEYYDQGVPPGMRYLPFWLAGFLHRFWLVAISMIAFAYPLSQFNLHLRKTRYHMKSHQVYEELLEMERVLAERHLAVPELRRIVETLTELNRKVIHIRVPTGSEQKYFDLLQAINLVLTRARERLSFAAPSSRAG